MGQFLSGVAPSVPSEDDAQGTPKNTRATVDPRSPTLEFDRTPVKVERYGNDGGEVSRTDFSWRYYGSMVSKHKMRNGYFSTCAFSVSQVLYLCMHLVWCDEEDTLNSLVRNTSSVYQLQVVCLKRIIQRNEGQQILSGK